MTTTIQQQEDEMFTRTRGTHYSLKRWMIIIILYIVIILVVLFSLYPLVMLLLNSFKSNNEININPGGLPVQWTIANYQTVLSSSLLRSFFNMVFVSVVTAICAVILSALAAFAFAKYKFKGRTVLFLVLIFTIMVPAEITLPPQYLIFAQLGWLNTYQVQIVPFIVPVFGVFLLRQYMLSIPDALIEAPRIDGANDLTIFVRIMLPLTMPALSVFGILQFLAMWNSYLWPQVMANDPSVAPLLLILPNLRDAEGFLPIWGTITAGCVLATVPVIILFLANQDRFMSGAVSGAVRE